MMVVKPESPKINLEVDYFKTETVPHIETLSLTAKPFP